VIDRESDASIDVVVTATSADSSTSSETFTIAVTDENDTAPQITSAATGSVDEGEQSVLTLTATDADTTAEPTVFSISGGADAALFEIVGGTELRFISAPDFEAAADSGGDNAYNVTIQASDGTNVSTQAITVTVNDVNEAPSVTLVQTVASVDENSDVSAGIKVADISVSDDALGTHSLSLSGADSGRFEIRNNELFFVGSAPDFETQSSYDVSVDVDDASIVGTPDDSAALTLDINDVNEAPVAVQDTVNAVEDVLAAPTGNLLANDSDVDDRQSLNVFSVNGNSTVVAGDLVATGIYGDLVVDADSGEFIYTLNTTTAQSLAAGQVVTDTFTYVAADDGTPVQTASSSLVVTVTGTNDQPIARADTASVTEDVTLAASGNVISDTRGTNAQGAGDITDIDIDATDVLTVVAVNGLPGNVGGVVEGLYGNMTVGANGDYTYTLGVTVAQQATVDALREGDAPVETFTYTVRDSAGDTDATTLKVTVNGTNDIPTLSVAPLARTLTSGQADVIASNAAVADPDNDISAITVSLDVSANSNAADTALDSADVLGFDGSFLSFLTSQGFTVEGGTNGDDLVITAPDGEPLGNTFAEAILEQVKYTAGDSSFGFNANDRVVSVTLTDIVGASSTPVQITIDMQADVSDGAGASAFVGGNLADTVFGGAGDDTITGLEGDDEIDGGDDTDTAVYQGDLSGYTVSTTADASGFVTSFDTVEDIETGDTDEGTDTLNSVEALEFNDQTITLAKAVQLFSGAPGTGNLAGTFDTIQAAIDAAEAGDTILVNGTGGPGGTVYAASESLSIDKGVTIEGLGAVSVVSIAVSGGGAGQVVDIDNLDVAAASAASSAVQIDESATYDSVTFQNGDVTGGTQHGLLVGSGSNPVVAATTASNVASIVIENATFSGNGTAPSNGSSGLTFFGYNNDLTLTDVTVVGGMGTDNGIQLRGLDASAPAGAVIMDGVEITGSFLKTGMAIYNFADLAGFDLAGADPAGSLDIDVSAAFAGLNIDGVGGDVDLAATDGLAVANGLAGSPDINVNAAAGEVDNLLTGDASDDILSGNAGDDTIQGGAGRDILLGGAGADSLSGGAGDDTIIQFVGEGASDDISGGSETDTVVLLDNAATDDAVSVIYDGSNLTSLDGASLSGVETVTAHVDTGLGAGGTLAPLAGDTGVDTLSYAGTTAAVTVDLEQGTATGFGVNPLLTFAGAPNSAISGFENVTGGAGDDRLDGDTGANVIDGGAGLDTTQYDGTVLASQFSATATGWQVATTAEGTDTLEGIERVEHADGAILLVGNGGYTSIQDAIDAAANGDTILVAPGIYAEDLALDVAVNIIGISGDASDVTIGSVRIGSGLTGAGALTIEIANITVDADQGSAASGVVYAGSYDGTSNALAGLTLDNLDVSGFAQTGIVVNGGGSGFVAEVTDVNVSDSGATGTSGGTGGITFFEFLGDVAFNGVSVEGNSVNADHGIQIAGFRDSDNGISAPIGNVTFTDTEVTGTFEKTLAIVQGYNDLAGLDFTGGLTLNGTATWTGLYVNPTFGSNVTPATVPSTVDLTGVNVTGGSYGTNPSFAQTGNAGVVVVGTGVGGTITGSDSDPNVFVGDAIVGTTESETINAGAGADLIYGGGGNDTLNGGTGNDTFVTFVGDGSDVIDGGSNGGGTDTPGDTVILSNVFPGLGASPALTTIDVVATPVSGGFYVQANGGVDFIDGVENLDIILGNGFTSIDLTGDLAAEGLTSVDIGTDPTGTSGAGGNVVDASGLTSGSNTIVSASTGAGVDLFRVNDGATANIFHAGDDMDTVSFSGFTGPVTVDLNDTGSGQSATGFAQISGVENVAGTSSADTLTGNADDNQFVTNGGGDTIVGGAGNDTVVLNAARSDYTYAVAADGTMTFTQGSETTTIADDVEFLAFNEIISPIIDLTNPVRVVDGAGSLMASYASIQAAVDAAETTDGMTVQILGQAAAFAESVNTAGKALTFEGVTIDGNRAVIDPASGNGFSVTGNTGGGDVSFVNLDITGGADGIFVDDEANVGTLTITDSNITDNATRGLMVLGESGSQEGAAEVIITDSTFSGNGETTGGHAQVKLFGFSGDATFTGLTVAGAAGTAAAADRPDNAIEITGNVNGGSANNGGTPPNIGTIDFVDVTVTGAYHKNPVAIFNYGEIDNLTITDLDLSGAESDWGPLFNIDGVTDDSIDASGYGITFPAGYGIVSEIQGEKIGQADVDTTIIGTASDDRIHGKTGDDSLDGGAGDDQIYGAEKGASGTSAEAGNDDLTGGAGDDYLNGGAETDTGAGTTAEGDVAVYIGGAGDQITTADLTSVTGTNPVGGASFAGVQVNATGLTTDQGTDTLDNVEIIETRDAGGALISRILLVGDGGFGTLQAAIDEAEAGDTIRIAAGTYTQGATLDKALTIVGAQEGIDGSAHSGASTVMQGTLRVTAASGDVVIDGIQFQNVSDDAVGFDALELAGGADITVRNNLFFSTGVNGSNTAFDKAIHVETGATGNVDITGNSITGAAAGGYSTASWNRGIYSDGRAASLNIDGNSIEFARTAVNLDDYDDATTTVTNNVVTSSGSGISVGIGSDSAITGVTDNTFNDVGTEFNLRNLNTQVTFDAGTNAAENTLLPDDAVASGDSFLNILGGTVGDDLTGNSGADWIEGRDGNDTIDGAGGDDVLLGGAGSDSLSGGAGADTLSGGDAADELFGNADDDLLIGGAGADTLDGGEGADTLYGFDDMGDEANTIVDSATYATGATIAWNDADGRWEVTADGETDQLYGIEKVTVGTDTFLLVDDATGATAGGFSSVTEAEAAAVGGETILVANGTYAGATLTKAVTVQGVGNAAGETVFSSGFTVNLAADGAQVTLRDFALENVAGTSIKAQDTEVLDTLRIENVRVEGGAGSGLVVGGRKQSDAYDQAGVQNVEIVNSDFIDNAQSSGNNGNIVLFEYDGDVEITNVTSSNAVAGANSAAYLVQMSGFDGPRYDQKTPGSGSSVGSYDVLTAMGTVVIDGLDVSGNARKPGLYIQGFTDLTGLDITNSTVDVDSGWRTPVIIDPMADQSPTGTPNMSGPGNAFFDETSADASYDLSGLSVVQKSYQVEVTPGVFETRQQVVVVEGTSQSETITGTNANDYFVGFGGDDVLSGAGGDDQFIFISGDGEDTVDGGGDTDTLDVTGSAVGDDVTISDTAVTIVGGGSVAFSDIEITNLSGDAGADTFRFIDTSLTGGPDYAVDGGADTDTLDFAGYDNGVTVSLIGQTFNQTGAAQTHSVINVANLDGSLHNDTLTGDNSANDIDGSDGQDILNGLNGSDTLTGGAGNDELYGGNGADVLHGGGGADFLNGGGGSDTIRYDSLAEGTDGLIFDLVIGYSTQDSDVFLINRAGFAGLGGENAGVLEAENFVSANINEATGAYFGFTPGQATFVFDDTGTSLSGNRELWYDAEGDGSAVKMLEFNSGSNLSGFDFSDFLLA
jgi:Ca2+-binding RTX toxin-like protein